MHDAGRISNNVISDTGISTYSEKEYKEIIIVGHSLLTRRKTTNCRSLKYTYMNEWEHCGSVKSRVMKMWNSNMLCLLSKTFYMLFPIIVFPDYSGLLSAKK